jgi:hypothetical protein
MVWRDDAGAYRAAFSRHRVVLESISVVRKAELATVLDAWLPQMRGEVATGDSPR